VDQETAYYIINYFSRFLSVSEGKAIRHENSLFKVGHNEKLLQIHTERGWISNDPEVQDLLKDGFETFRIRTAARILKDNDDLVFLNKCPQCSKLTRTPYAKQCKHCYFDWH
jgi:hypothetical protein